MNGPERDRQVISIWRMLPGASLPVPYRTSEPQHIGMGVVERSGGDADHVGLAPVAEHAVGGEVLEQCAPARTATADTQGKWRAASSGFGKSGTSGRIESLRRPT